MKNTTRNIINRVLYFFPFQLVLLHIKRNHLLLVFWFLLWGYTGNFLASKYGVSYLFLYPEYLGEINFSSFAITGFALGGFIMAFNIYTYIIHAHRFPFLATLSKPFYKFTVNNFIIPAAYSIFYIYKSAHFQYTEELVPSWTIFTNILGFISGLLFFFALSFAYFFTTNKTIDAYIISDEDHPIQPPNPSLRSKGNWYYNKAGKISWRVDSYLKNFGSIKLARDTKHYDKHLLRKVFFQNHINATIFELLLILSFFLIGVFSDYNFFIAPGGASIMLSFTFLLMIISVFLSWARGWTLTLLIVLAFAFNFLSSKENFSFFKNQMYGMDYSDMPTLYNETVLNAVDPSVIEHDMTHQIQTLEHWLAKVQNDQNEKPKLIIINCSGGGLRSALWTSESLAYADSLTQGRLLNHTVLFTGASGGMLGAAYVRELRYRQQKTPWYSAPHKFTSIGNDILNPLLLHLTTFDLFSGIRQYTWDGVQYPKDRAFSFEKRLNKNTYGMLDKKLSDYYAPVHNASMPMMILSPTIVNDGRRMLISSQPISFMSPYLTGNGGDHQNIENIEFARFLKQHNAQNIRFSSALRANATFPYILPQVDLPTSPKVVLMDAGLRDNYGFKTSFQYIYAMQDWIKENTSGVILLQVRDKSKHIYPSADQSNTMFSRLLTPLGNIYSNFTKVHDYTHDQLLEVLETSVDFDLEEIYIEMSADQALNVSMSYHLTKKEKLIIHQALYKKQNKQAFERLQNLLDNK